MPTSPAYLNCTGPCFLFANNAASQIVQIGTCEQHPIISTEFEWEEVFNDIGGSKIAFDEQYMGQIDMIAADLNRLYIPETNVLEAAPFPDNGSLQVPGLDLQSYLGATVNSTNTNWLLSGIYGASGTGASRGTYLNQNGQGIPLWIVYSYYGTANVLVNQGLPAGIYYPNIRFARAITPEQGTKTYKHRLELMAFPLFGIDGNGNTSFWTKSSAPGFFTG